MVEMKWFSLKEKRPEFNTEVLIAYDAKNNGRTVRVVSAARTYNLIDTYKKFIEEDIANGDETDLEVDKTYLRNFEEGLEDPLRFTVINSDGEEECDDILPYEVLMWAEPLDLSKEIREDASFVNTVLRLNALGFNVKDYNEGRIKTDHAADAPYVVFHATRNALLDICNVVPLRGKWITLNGLDYGAAIMCPIFNENDRKQAVIDLDTWIDGLEEHFSK